jgi:hypothetical protein
MLSRWLGQQGVIFVIDSTDHDRLSEARDELHRIMKEDSLENTLVLVLANKQGACAVLRACVRVRMLTLVTRGAHADMPKALSKEEIAEALELSSLSKKWHIEATCATTGEGMPLYLSPPSFVYTGALQCHVVSCRALRAVSCAVRASLVQVCTMLSIGWWRAFSPVPPNERAHTCHHHQHTEQIKTNTTLSLNTKERESERESDRPSLSPYPPCYVTYPPHHTARASLLMIIY